MGPLAIAMAVSAGFSVLGGLNDMQKHKIELKQQQIMQTQQWKEQI